ncbi:heterokaryon incompatibility protein-domain-containing protein, partial [Lophiotrema nucula]
MISRNELVALKYHHPRLSGSKSIRILELYPAELGSGEPLRGRLIDVSLNQQPEYEALSYAWGSTDRVEELHCGSKIIRITRNCWQALRRLRLERRVRYLWIDSICIDQDNHQERNHQVGLMGDVYRQARCVLVWLGKGNEETDAAVRYLEDVATKARAKSLRTLTLDVPLDRKIIKVMDHDNAVLEQLTSLFERTWFKRVWPVQEIALSRRCRLLSGGSSISLADFMSALGCL